jgi:hypothetical protein
VALISGLGYHGVSGSGPHSFAASLQGLEEKDMLPGRGKRQEELAHCRYGISSHHQRLSPAQAIRPASRENLEDTGQAVAHPADEANRHAASTKLSDEKREDGLDDLAADVVEKADNAQQEDVHP